MKSSNPNANLLGRYYPYFLSNQNLKDSHYLYQVFSPKLDSNSLEPLVSLCKVSEKTHQDQPCGADSDILTVCAGKKMEAEEQNVMVRNFLKKEDIWAVKRVQNQDPKLFPSMIIQNGNIVNQKSVILGLRDALRWKHYKFLPGYFVDVMWTKTEFVVFEICGTKEDMWLEPRKIYSVLDTNLQNGVDIDLPKFETEHWKQEKSRASEINRFIKGLEWDSFNRNPIMNH